MVSLAEYNAKSDKASYAAVRALPSLVDLCQLTHQQGVGPIREEKRETNLFVTFIKVSINGL